MKLFVVDASVAAKWVHREEYYDCAKLLLNEANELHAPDFLLLEMDNVLCKWARQGVFSIRDCQERREALPKYPVILHDLFRLRDEAFALAQETRRSAYDCLYLALAQSLGAPMVTADRKLYGEIHAGRLKKWIIWVGDLPSLPA
jgi:predicted nucleic acid-binding protein